MPGWACVLEFQWISTFWLLPLFIVFMFGVIRETHTHKECLDLPRLARSQRNELTNAFICENHGSPTWSQALSWTQSQWSPGVFDTECTSYSQITRIIYWAKWCMYRTPLNAHRLLTARVKLCIKESIATTLLLNNFPSLSIGGHCWLVVVCRIVTWLKSMWHFSIHKKNKTKTKLRSKSVCKNSRMQVAC